VTIFTHLLALWVGVCLGIIIMCILSINRIEPLDIEEDIRENDDFKQKFDSTNG